MDKGLLSAIERKLPFRDAKRLLAANGLPTGLSWRAIYDKLKSSKVAAKADYSGLRADFVRALAVSEKAARAYVLEDDKFLMLQSWAETVRPNQKKLITSRFPYLLSDAELSSAPDAEPRLISKFSTGIATYLVFSSVRRQRIRERLPVSMFPDTLPAAYEEIYGIKEYRGQTFETLVIPRSGNHVFSLIEFPDGTTQETRRAAHALLRNKVNALVGVDVLDSIVNLYPLMKPIYNCDAGKIKRLSYTTRTDSEKRERMRQSGVCLREEIGHKSGIKALGNEIEAYDLGVVWVLPNEGAYLPKVELDIVGTYRMTYDTNPLLIDAVVSRCVRVEEFEEILSTLIQALEGRLTARPADD